MFSALMEEHDQIRLLAIAMQDHLLCEEPYNAQTLYHLREKLTASLNAHGIAEDETIYAVLSDDHRPGVVGLSQRIAYRRNEWFIYYLDYQKRWSSDDVTSRWQAFRLEALELIQLLLRELDWEEEDLYPAVLQVIASVPPFSPISIPVTEL